MFINTHRIHVKEPTCKVNGGSRWGPEIFLARAKYSFESTEAMCYSFKANRLVHKTAFERFLCTYKKFPFLIHLLCDKKNLNERCPLRKPNLNPPLCKVQWKLLNGLPCMNLFQILTLPKMFPFGTFFLFFTVCIWLSI